MRKLVCGRLALTAAVSAVCALALAAPASAYVYWTDWSDGTIGRANLDGTDVDQSFISGGAQPFGVTANAQRLYWSNNNTGTIGAAFLDGSAVNQSFATGAGGPWGMAVDSQHLYWANPGGNGIGRQTCHALSQVVRWSTRQHSMQRAPASRALSPVANSSPAAVWTFRRGRGSLHLDRECWLSRHSLF